MNTTDIKKLYDSTLEKVRSDFSEQATTFEAAIKFLDLLDNTYSQQILNSNCSKKSFCNSIRSKKYFSTCVDILGISKSMDLKMSISKSLSANEDTEYINAKQLKRYASNLLWSGSIPMILAKHGIFNSEASNIEITLSNTELLTEHALSLYSINTDLILPLINGNILKLQHEDSVKYYNVYHELIAQLPTNTLLMRLFSPNSEVPLKEALTFYPDIILHKKECIYSLLTAYNNLSNVIISDKNTDDLISSFKPLLELLFNPDTLKPAYMAWELSTDIQTFVDTLQDHIETAVATELPELY